MTDQSRPHEPGDLGRRIALRRREQRLSRAELAGRAGLAESYVEYLEEGAPQVSSGALLRLASALDTTAPELLGATAEVPPGRRSPTAHSALEAMDEHECRRLLGLGGVGRLVFVGERGPVAVPVNFRAVDGDLVFRTEPDSSLAAAPASGAVSFEVDRIDDAMTSGWSVLATGRVRPVDDPDELETVRAAGIEPWAGGERELYLRFSPSELSGRRIRPVG